MVIKDHHHGFVLMKLVMFCGVIYIQTTSQHVRISDLDFFHVESFFCLNIERQSLLSTPHHFQNVSSLFRMVVDLWSCIQ